MSCTLPEVNTTLHPITLNIVSEWRQAGWGIMPPDIKSALDIAVRAGIVEPFPMFVTVAGAFQSDDLIGKRIVSCNAEGVPLDPTNSADISLDPETGIVTSSVTAGRHWITYGYYNTTYSDLIPDED